MVDFKHVFIHPDYQNNPYGDYLAIIEIKQKMELNGFLREAVALPNMPLNINDYQL